MPSIEELIRQATGKGFDEMTDEELIDLVNSSRNCYQILNQAAQARKERRTPGAKKAAVAKEEIDWASIDLFGDGAVAEEAPMTVAFADEDS
jgi:orotate phosphoribosyltransferase-like protein